MKYSKNMLWTILTIDITDNQVNIQDIDFCFGMVASFEQKYSRFIPNNFLDTLNQKKYSEIDPEFYSILQLCLKISKLSEWYFDISILPFLENSGYGITQDKLDEVYWYENIELSQKITNKQIQYDNIQHNNIQKNTQHTLYYINLKNNISIEIGSVGKWYLIDKIYNHLSKKYSHFIIDFGGDIKTCWKYTIQLDSWKEYKKSIGSIELNNLSIASSNGQKRAYNSTHHLVNTHKQLQKTDIKNTLFVTHKLSALSDIIATALFVSPLPTCKKIISSIPWLEAYIIFENWSIYSTPWFNGVLYEKSHY